MTKNVQNIIKEKIKKTNLLKTELLLNIKKSILQNNNIKTQIKLYAILQIIKGKKNTFMSKPQNPVRADSINMKNNRIN